MVTRNKFIVLLSAAVLLAVTLACRFGMAGGSDQRSGSPDTQSAGESSTVTVTASEFSLVFEPEQPQAGEVTFIVTNDGNIAHDFRIRGNDVDHRTPMIDPGEQETLTVTLEPGSYNYECTVLGHDMLGMKGTFRVGNSASETGS